MTRVRNGLVAIGLFFSIFAILMLAVGPESSLYEVRWVFYAYIIIGSAIWLYSLFVLLILIWHHPEKIRRYIPFYDTWIGDFFTVFRVLWIIPHFISSRWQMDPDDL